MLALQSGARRAAAMWRGGSDDPGGGLPQTVIERLLMEIEQRSTLLRNHGIEIRFDRCKM